jgi:hypothetical protein
MGMFYGPSYEENYRRAAALADKILRGARPSELPVENPTKFELVINLKTAHAGGHTDDRDHPFRRIATTCSERSRPAVRRGC